MQLKEDLLGWALALITNIRTRPERLVNDKHFSLLRTFVNFGCKKFYETFFFVTDEEALAVCPWQAFPALSNILGQG